MPAARSSAGTSSNGTRTVLSAHGAWYTSSVATPVMPSEVAARDHAITSSICPRQSHCCRRRLGAALQELHALRAWNDLAEPLRQLDLAPARQPGDVSFRRGVDHRLRDTRLGVAECYGAERHCAVDEGSAVHVGDAAPACRHEMCWSVGALVSVKHRRALAPGRCAGWEHRHGALAPAPRRCIRGKRVAVFGDDGGSVFRHLQW